VGVSPTRQPLQPEATGAVMEVTKWLKPSVSVSRIGDSASVMSPAFRSDVAGHLRLHDAQAIAELIGDQRSKSYTMLRHCPTLPLQNNTEK
jgi:hypothetical protein